MKVDLFCAQIITGVKNVSKVPPSKMRWVEGQRGFRNLYKRRQNARIVV
jgi:hypothetical protein